MSSLLMSTVVSNPIDTSKTSAPSELTSSKIAAAEMSSSNCTDLMRLSPHRVSF